MASADKPLPKVPNMVKETGSHTARLTVESRAHLKEFIRYTLLEEKLDDVTDWAKGIELALNELVNSISRGGWLPGFKRARRLGAVRRNEKERKRLEKEHSEKDDEVRRTKSRISEDKGDRPSVDRRDDDPPPRKDNTNERRRAALEQLHLAVASPAPPSPKISPRHLLLTLSPKGAVLPSRDVDFDIIPANKLCAFIADKYALPTMEEWDRGTGGMILFGLDEWSVESPDSVSEDRPKIVGGTFSFTGLSSSEQLQSLSKVLRLSVYMLLSLLLEQSLLADSNIELHYPPTAEIQPLLFSLTSPEVPTRHKKPHNTRTSAAAGLWSFITRRAEGLLGRSSNSAHAAHTRTPYTRAESLDPSFTNFEGMSLTPRSRKLPLSLHPASLRRETSRARHAEDDVTFVSILSRVNNASPLLTTSVGVTFPVPRVISDLADKEKRDGGGKLSGDERVSLTSLLGWEGRENRGRAMVGLQGFVKHQGITFLYTEYVPKDITAGKLELQNSKAPAITTPNMCEDGQKDIDHTAISPTTTIPVVEQTKHFDTCDRPRLITYQYYRWTCSQQSNRPSSLAPQTQSDQSLGEMIESLCVAEGLLQNKCSKPGCASERCKHRRLWIHGGLRISSEVQDEVEGEGSGTGVSNLSLGSGGAIYMWASCSVCKKETEKKKMADGTYLYSFAKYLELLIYSPSLCVLTPSLCEHTTPTQHPVIVCETSPQTRFNIIRHFKHGSRSVQFTLSNAPPAFELRMPRLQVVKGRAMDAGNVGGKPGIARREAETKAGVPLMERSGSGSGNEEKGVLRKEIKDWWQGVAEHLDRLDEHFVNGELKSHHKSLPRIPTDIDPYESDEDILKTQMIASLPPLPPSRSTSYASSRPSDDDNDDQRTIRGMSPRRDRSRSRSQSREGSSSLTVGGSTASTITSVSTHQLLLNLRHSFQQIEQTLYAQLSQTPVSRINDVRRDFSVASRSAKLRLHAWEKKHVLRRSGLTQLGKLVAPEPGWWKPGCHAIPGGKVVVREAEWGSVIAFTLSSVDYVQELAKMTSPRGEQGSTDIVTRSNSLSSNSTARMPQRSVTLSSTTTSTSRTSTSTELDPDIDTVWCEPEAHSAIIARQDNPRDTAGLLSLRDVLRHRQSADSSPSTIVSPSKFSPSKFMSLRLVTGHGMGSPRTVSLCTPPSAWAEPAVEVSKQAAGGLVSGLPEAAESAEKLLQGLEAVAESGQGSTFLSGPWKANASPDPEGGKDTLKERPPSLVSVESDILAVDTCQTGPVGIPEPPETVSQTSASATSTSERPSSSSVSGPPPTPASQVSTTSDARPPSVIPEHKHEQTPSSSTASHPSITSSLASTVTNAMRYLLSTSDQIPRPTSPFNHHKLLALDNIPVEDRPHIKYEWTVGKRLRFTCVVYYARQFDLLRKRCGVEEMLPKSLERSENWAAEGGKSRSNFWKTSDDRFVIKTLVDAWNVADLQVLLDIAPSYFRHMESTSSRPSALAKLLGFYTVEIKNLESGSIQAKADLLVMENLFYNRNVTKTFDLKGIQGRKCKGPGVNLSKSSASEGKEGEKEGAGKVGQRGKRTLFDGDWIEDQQRSLTLVQPHSKLVLNEAIKADSDFLSRCNIMDYSLLLGIDEENRQIACGLVDTIGSYTFAKTLEYKAKQNLQGGRETTVIPPAEYQTRFVNAINSYFLPCPDKWTRHDSQMNVQELTLPSVL